MVLRKKLALLFTLSSVGALSLVGCSSTDSSQGGTNSSNSIDPYTLLANEMQEKL